LEALLVNGGVPVAVAPVLGRLHEPLNLGHSDRARRLRVLDAAINSDLSFVPRTTEVFKDYRFPLGLR
jgi:hypothetical protein